MVNGWKSRENFLSSSSKKTYFCVIVVDLDNNS